MMRKYISVFTLVMAGFFAKAQDVGNRFEQGLN
jgi:hypothetical protein